MDFLSLTATVENLGELKWLEFRIQNIKWESLQR